MTLYVPLCDLTKDIILMIFDLLDTACDLLAATQRYSPRASHCFALGSMVTSQWTAVWRCFYGKATYCIVSQHVHSTNASEEEEDYYAEQQAVQIGRLMLLWEPKTDWVQKVILWTGLRGIRDRAQGERELGQFLLIPYMDCNKWTHDHPPWVGSDHDRSWPIMTRRKYIHRAIPHMHRQSRRQQLSMQSCWKLCVLSLMTSRIQCHFRTCTCHKTSMSVRSG